MTLRLKLEMPKVRLGLGSEIATRLVLENTGTDAIELASLFDNNVITNYVLSDQDDRVLATVNHVTRQLLLEKTEPRTGDERLIQLGPGAEESREDNFALYHWIDRPGTYRLRGLYRWRDLELTTEPVSFEVTSAPLVSLDTQWAYHYGEKFLLHSVWVGEVESGVFEAVFRESLRFRPQVINCNPPIWRQERPFFPKVSFQRSLLAGGAVWVGWIEDAGVRLLRIQGDRAESTPVDVMLPRGDAQWVVAPLAAADGSVVLVVSWQAPQGTELLLVRLDSEGKELARGSLQLPPARHLTGVCDSEGNFELVWVTPNGQECFAQAIDLDRLVDAAAPERIASSALPWAGLFLPPVLGGEGYFSTLALDESEQAYVLQWWSLTQIDDIHPVKTERVSTKDLDQIIHCSGQMNTIGHPFILVRRRLSLEYLNGSLLQTLPVAAPPELDPAGTEQLIVTPRNDVFVAAGLPGMGLRERLLHTGRDFDLSDLPAVDVTSEELL